MVRMMRMPRDFGWARVLLGAVTTLSLAVLLYLLVSVAIDSLLYVVIMGAGRLTAAASGDLQSLVNAISFLFHLAAVLAGFTVGSLVAGGSNRPYPGLRSAVSAVLASICVSVLLVVAVMLCLQQPISGPAEAYTRSENAGLVIFWLLIGHIVLSPLALLAGYIGGIGGRGGRGCRFGQPLPQRITDR